MGKSIFTYALICLAYGGASIYGQTSPARPQRAEQAGSEDLPKWKPPVRKKTVRPDVARYSPLAAAGGYQGQTRTWYDGMFEKLNPRTIDWGAVYERRKANLYDNMLYDKFFWYCVFLLVLSTLGLAGWYVASSDRRITARQAQKLVKTLKREAADCRKNAAEVNNKYNAHIEKCTLVAEALSSGGTSPAMSENARLKQEYEKLSAKYREEAVEKVRLAAELERQSLSKGELAARIEQLERRNGEPENNGTRHTAEQLVARINRLEEDLVRASRENKELRTALKSKTRTDGEQQC